VAPGGSTSGTLLLFNNLVRTAKKQRITITNVSCFMLFMEIIADYTENHTKHKNADLKTVKQVEQIFTTRL
jgi:hypothetical protein